MITHKNHIIVLMGILLGVIVFNATSLYAETIDIEIKGFDDGIKSDKQTDYKEAVLFAKRQAIERAGIKIESTSKVKNFILEEDYIETHAKSVLLAGYRVIDIGYTADGTYQVVLIGKLALLKDTLSPSDETKLSTVLFDSFDNNKNRWGTTNQTNKVAEIREGKLILWRGNRGWIVSSKTIPIDPNADFKIECTVEKLNGSNSHGFGLIWGRDKKNKRRYEFLINGNGKWVCNKRSGTNKLRINTDKAFTISPHINRGNSENRLAIIKSDMKLRFLINDKIVDEIPFQEFFGYRTGFILFSGDGGKKVAFDELSVSQKY